MQLRKTSYILLGLFIGGILLVGAGSVFAAVFLPDQGGTGNAGLGTGFIFFGGSTYPSAFATSSNLFWTNGTSRLTFKYGSSTALTSGLLKALDGNNGANLTLSAGDAIGNGDGGDLIFKNGLGAGAGNNGIFRFQSNDLMQLLFQAPYEAKIATDGLTGTDGNTGTLTLASGFVNNANGNVGDIVLNAGDKEGTGTGSGGNIFNNGGAGVGAGSHGGNVVTGAGNAETGADPGYAFFHAFDGGSFDSPDPGDIAFSNTKKLYRFGNQTGGGVFWAGFDTSALTGNHSYVLPDAGGTFCLVGGACSGAGVATTSFAATFPIQLSTSPLINYSFGGLATTAPWTIGNLTMVSSLNRITSVATGTATFSAPLSGGPFTVVGAGGAVTCTSCLTVTPTEHVSTSSSETTGRVPFWTSTGATPALLSGGSTNFTWDNTNSKLTFLSGTSTNLSATGSFFPPTTTSLPTNAISSSVAVNTISASSSLEIGPFSLFATTSVSFSWATSTPSAVATDTIPIVLGPRGQTFVNIACRTIGTGGATVRIGSGTASSSYIQAVTGTPAPTTLSSNNTFQAWQTLFIEVGGYQNTNINDVTCGLGRQYDY